MRANGLLPQRARTFCALGFVLCVSSSCEWFTDFKRTPMITTWESAKDSLTPPRGSPLYSVPVTGMAVAGFEVSYSPLPATIDSMASLPNPAPLSDASLANGRMHYQINCAVCHGDAGGGDGPAAKLGVPGISLVTEITRGRSDGYIFGMIRNGRGLMPSYNRIEDPDRWDVVNYIRGLQGTAGRQVETGPLAAPGVTGAMLPGASRTGPTRPSPLMDARGVIRRAGAPAVPGPAADTAGATVVAPAVVAPAAAPSPAADTASTQ